MASRESVIAPASERVRRRHPPRPRRGHAPRESAAILTPESKDVERPPGHSVLACRSQLPPEILRITPAREDVAIETDNSGHRGRSVVEKLDPKVPGTARK